MTKMWLRKIHFKRETESHQRAAKNDAICTNYVKVKIDSTQQNSKCWLCGKRDETINCIVKEGNTLVQKEYKTRYDMMGG